MTSSAALLLPQSGFAGDINAPVVGFPVEIASLTDGTHQGLVAANLAISYPPGVFGSPAVRLGSIPAGGVPGAWKTVFNSPQDGVLNILLSVNEETNGIMGTEGGSLVLIDFPVTLNPSDLQDQIIEISVRGPTGLHTQVVGNPGAYSLESLGLPATGKITINPV